MKRIATKLIIFLLLGAVVNVGVAYGVLLRVEPIFSFTSPITDPDRLPWPKAMPDDASHLILLTAPTLGTDRTEYTDAYYLDGVHVPGSIIAFLCRVGWPVRSFEGGYYKDPETGRIVQDGSILLQHEWQSRFWAVHHLPFRPSWMGLTFNTAFYGLILWLLWSAPFTARRLIRKRRGRCVKCGYDLSHAEHDVCPECGP